MVSVSDFLRDEVVDIRVSDVPELLSLVKRYGVMGGFSSKFIFDAFNVAVSIIRISDRKSQTIFNSY